MKIFKFRYADAEGKPYYYTLTLPSDAAQLIGHDLNGREVYEGDWLIDCVGNEFTATIHDVREVVHNFTLKEDSK